MPCHGIEVRNCVFFFPRFLKICFCWLLLILELFPSVQLCKRIHFALMWLLRDCRLCPMPSTACRRASREKFYGSRIINPCRSNVVFNSTAPFAVRGSTPSSNGRDIHSVLCWLSPSCCHLVAAFDLSILKIFF